MNVTLVENPEHDIHGGERGQDENPFARERILKRLRGPLEGTADAARQSYLARGRLNRVDRVAERNARREVEGNRHRGKLPLMVHGERGLVLPPAGKSIELDLIAGVRGDVDVLERIGRLPELGRDLHHDVILIELSVHGGDLALAERVVERVVDNLLR